MAERHNPHEMEEPSPKRQKTLEMEPDEASADECDGVSVEQLTEPVLYHFKILYDQTWDYKKICDRFFEKTKPYLCVLEHVNQPNTHVHFQGYSTSTHNTVKAKITRLVSKHHLRKLNPKCRPSSMSCRPVDVTGFQYMAKEMKKEYVLASNMFSEEDLQELKENSVLHCTKLKTCVKEFIAGMKASSLRTLCEHAKDVNQLVNLTGAWLFKASEEKLIELPEYNKHHTRCSVIRGLLAHPDLGISWKGQLYVL